MASLFLALHFQVYYWLLLVSTLFASSSRACFFILTDSQGIFAPPLYPEVNLNIELCTWQLEAPIGKVVEITFEEVVINGTDDNGNCFDNITVFDGTPPSLSEIIPPFCGDGPSWPRYPTQLLSQSHIMTVTLKKELDGSRGFRASYKHVISREEFVAVIALEEPTIFLFDRFSSPSFFPQIALIGATSPSALSFDRITKFFYFTDIQSKFIGRISLETPATVEKLITDNLQNPLGVAVAYLTGLLYWTDANRQEVSVSTLNGTFRKAIMTSTPNCQAPRGIVLSQDQQYVFWTCETRIVKSRADGSEQDFDFVSSGIFNATALAIDHIGAYLYWVDAHRGLIDRVRVDGFDRASVYNSEEGILEKAHSFVISEFACYLTHNSEQQMYYYGKLEQSERTVHPVVQQTLRGLSYYNSDTDTPETHPCVTENGGCNELCFPAGNSVKCDDITPRIFNCPDDVIKTSASFSESIFWSEPTATSRSSDQNKNVPYLSRSHVPMSVFTRGTTKVLYVFEDDLGNKAKCSFNVIVQPTSSTTIIASTLPTVVKFPSPSTDSISVSNSTLLYAVIGSVLLAVFLTAAIIVVAVLCSCRCCECDCHIKEKRSMTDEPTPMTNHLAVGADDISHYYIGTHDPTGESDYFTVLE